MNKLQDSLDQLPAIMSNKTVAITGCVYSGETSITIIQKSIAANRKTVCIDGLKYNLPECLPQTVVGREKEIIEIYKLLTSKMDHRKRVAITGMGGVGKTYLAFHCALTWCNSLASNHKTKNYFNCAAMIDSQTKNTFENSIKGLADKLNIPSEQSLLEIIKEIVDTYKTTKMVFILDSIDSCEIASDLLSVQDGNKHIFILATSQNRELQNTFRCLDLPTLNEDDSMALINDIVKEGNIKADTLKELCGLCGGLPLALSQAAATIKDNITYNADEEYLYKYVHQFRYMLSQPFPDDFHTINRKTAYITIKINIDKLQNNESKRVLQFCMHVNPTKIDLNIFRCAFEQNQLLTALRELKKYSLICEDISANTILVPRLIQEVCMTALEPNHRVVLDLLLTISSNSVYYLDHMDFFLGRLPEGEINKMIENSSCDDVIKMCKEIFRNCFQDKVVEILKDAGCKVVDPIMWPDLVIVSAIGFYSDEVTRAVLNKFQKLCPNLNICGSDGIEPMHVAAASSSRFIVKCLLKKGALSNTTPCGK